MSLGRGGGTRKRYPPGFYSDSEHNPICHPSLHMLQIREESSFIQARRKEMKPRVRVGVIQARRKEMKPRVRVGGEKGDISKIGSLCIITFQLCQALCSWPSV